jgi:hypothetical protein
MFMCFHLPNRIQNPKRDYSVLSADERFFQSHIAIATEIYNDEWKNRGPHDKVKLQHRILRKKFPLLEQVHFSYYKIADIPEFVYNGIVNEAKAGEKATGIKDAEGEWWLFTYETCRPEDSLFLNVFDICRMESMIITWNFNWYIIRIFLFHTYLTRCIRTPRLNTFFLDKSIILISMQQWNSIECGDARLNKYGNDCIQKTSIVIDNNVDTLKSRSSMKHLKLLKMKLLKHYYSTTITIQDGKKNPHPLPPQMLKLKQFIVVHIKTLVYMKRYQQCKIPYSAAFIMVRPNQPLVLKANHLFPTEDSPVIPNQLPVRKAITTDDSRVTNILSERGSQLVHSLLTSLTRVVKNEKRSINVYFTNLNRDDGYSLLRNSLIHPHNLNFKCSPLTRYNNISNMRVYDSVNNRLLFKVRDLNDLLCYINPDELVNLFCQEHCSRECNPKMISIDNQNQSSYRKHMIHDIMLHAAIMQKAQELHWRNFHIDLFYKQNIAEKVKKTPNLWIANI